MKKYYLPIILICTHFSTNLLTSCSVKLPSERTPKPSNYSSIEDVKTINGYPKKRSPWVVISDREDNTVYVDKKNQKSPKEIKFLEPLLVLDYKKSSGLIKVAEYLPDALLKKTQKNAIKSYGWIPEDQLLLWTNSLKNEKNGFTLKASLVPNNIDVINNSSKYLKNDSVLIYTSPTLTKLSKVKLPIGQLVYIYKEAENNKRYLIGRSPQIKFDSYEDNIYGWVDSNVLSYWGEKYAIKITEKINYDSIINEVQLINNKLNTNLKLVNDYPNNPLEIILPISLDKNKKDENNLKYYTNILNYSNNFVYNVSGNPIYFNKYKEIVANSKKINLVFVLDISRQNVKSEAIAKSILQDFEIKLNKLKYYSELKFSIVLYKNNTCGNNIVTSELYSNIDEVTKFIDTNIKEMKCDGTSGQPYQEAIAKAGSVLKNVPDETNLIVAIGSTAVNNRGISEAIRNVSQARAKIIAFQSYSGSDSNFNNFVLNSENIITNSAKNIAKLKMEKIVEQNEVINKNNYNLVENNNGFYSLDYPKTSMTQGFIIYPKKGDVTPNNLLISAIDSLISQVTYENKEIENNLTEFFKSKIGVSKTDIKPNFKYLYPNTPHPIPFDFSSQLINLENPFLVKGEINDNLKYSPLLDRGILISSEEYELLRNLYLSIYRSTIIDNKPFNQNTAIKRFIKIVKDEFHVIKKLTNNELMDKTMADLIAMSTGFDTYNEEIMKYSLNKWRKEKFIDPKIVELYFDKYKKLADKLLENKNNSNIIIQQNGETYYWLNQDYLPNLANDIE